MSKQFLIESDDYALVNCYSCGVRYLIPVILNNAALGSRGPGGRQIHCPNGHRWHYIGETTEENVRRERDRAVQEQARLAEELAAAERAKERALAEARRIKKRAAAALCPCCNRHFA